MLWVLKTYVFLEKCEKLSLNYPQIPSLSVLLNCTFEGSLITQL